MYAFGIPVTLRNIFLIIAANSVSSTFAVTPGGVGTQQAMASVALRNVAPASTVTAYSLSQQLIMCAWNIAFGLTLMATTFGWSSDQGADLGLSQAVEGGPEELSDLAEQDEQPGEAEQPVSPPPASRSAVIRFSSAPVSFFSANEFGHMFPSSSFALSLKPNVA